MAIAYTLLSIIRSVYRCSPVNARTVNELGTAPATHGRASNQKGKPREPDENKLKIDVDSVTGGSRFISVSGAYGPAR